MLTPNTLRGRVLSLSRTSALLLVEDESAKIKVLFIEREMVASSRWDHRSHHLLVIFELTSSSASLTLNQYVRIIIES